MGVTIKALVSSSGLHDKYKHMMHELPSPAETIMMLSYSWYQ